MSASIMNNHARPATLLIEILCTEDSPAHAPNGQLVRDRIRRHKPALILSDITMPEMDGYTLRKAITSTAAWEDIPVVMAMNLHRAKTSCWAWSAAQTTISGSGQCPAKEDSKTHGRRHSGGTN